MNQIQPMYSDVAFTPGSTSNARFFDQRSIPAIIVGDNKLTNKEAVLAQMRQNDLVQFCKQIMRKECVKFVPKIDGTKKNANELKRPDVYRCVCGELPQKHKKNSIGVPQYYESGIKSASNDLSVNKIGEEWNAEDAIKEFPTNAFGKIDFVYEDVGGRKPAKYIRLADNTNVDLILHNLFENHWHMMVPHTPSLVITIIGGAKNFQLDGKKKDIFNHGLVNAAKTTHAWIITGGCNMGVMKAVGEAVAEGQSYDWNNLGMTHTLRCIGIAPWGYIESRDRLVSKNDEGCWNATYKVNNVILHEQPVSLNPDHTHFLFIDDGKRNVYGGAGKFRAELERKISLPRSEGGLGIPVVLVVVEGGTDAISDAYASLKKGVPVVLCEGTGRAADILAYAFNHFHINAENKRVIMDKYKLIVSDMLKRAYGKTWFDKKKDEKEEIQKNLDLVLKCCENENLITVFDMNKLNEDLDLYILSALLKGQGASDSNQLKEQLMLALTWNRSDIAEDKIFTKNVSWEPGQLDDIMTRALKENKVKFVRLLLLNGVVMKEYLTVSHLRELYDAAPMSSHIRCLLKYSKVTLNDVDHLLGKLLGKHNDEIYRKDTLMIMKGTEATIDDEKFDSPFRELLKWAVLLNRQEMAKFIWERGDEAVPSALTASRLYGALSDTLAHYDSSLQEDYAKHKQEFENLAVKLIDECHNTSAEKAKLLVERRYLSWGNMDCLEIAAAAQNKEFLSTPCCQNSLNERWKNKITSAWPKLITCLIFPFIIPYSLHMQGERDELIAYTASEKFRAFYTAPMMKFTTNVIMEMCFICLFSYMILFGYGQTVGPIEIAVMIWVSIDIVEELRQIFFTTDGTLKEKISNWWNFSLFNRIDALVLLLALVAFLLRLSPDNFIAAKMIYSVVCILLFIRLLRDYTASSYLGPKLVMINRMFKDLILYVLILLVALCAFGISVRSLMYPVQEFYPLIFRDIFYYPYWMLYGQLFMDEMTGMTDQCLANSTAIMPDGNICPTYNWLTLVYTALYLIIANTLLINVLIAIFNHVFEEIETNSIQIWKFGMYFLVVEYEQKPVLAPPLIVLEHIGLFFKFICTRTCCSNSSKELEAPDLTLQIFERECCKQLLHKKRLSEKENLPSKVQYIRSKVDEMAKLLEEEKMFEQNFFENQKTFMEDIDTETTLPQPYMKFNQRRDTAKYVTDMKSTAEKMEKPIIQNIDEAASISGKGATDVKALEKFRENIAMPSQREVAFANASFIADVDNSQNLLDPLAEHSIKQSPKKIKKKKQKTNEEKAEGFEEEFSPASDQSGSENDNKANTGKKRQVKRPKKETVTNAWETERQVQPFMSVNEINSDLNVALIPRPGNVSNSMEERITRLEERTYAALDNIETLLRGVVFSRSSYHSQEPFMRRNYDRFY